MTIYLIYPNYYDFEGKHLTVGGIQTYITHLGEVCSDMGINPVLIQRANTGFIREENKLRVVGIPTSKRNYGKDLLQHTLKLMNHSQDAIIFMENHLAHKTDVARSITIQHGVSWDLPVKYMTNHRFLTKGVFGWMLKVRASYRAAASIKHTRFLVCVDYNFINWYKTTQPYSDNLKTSIFVIPNAAQIATPEQIVRKLKRSLNEPVKVIFARRFTEYRGTRIMAEVTKQILSNTNKAVHFSFAGEGPDYIWLKNEFLNEKRVSFITYTPEQVTKKLLEYDISVIPSIASEGTSYAVAEAMGAGCAVVASAVGGITNMLINGYNGLLVQPDPYNVGIALMKLLDDDLLRDEISMRAYETAAKAFSLEQWKNSWVDILHQISKDPHNNK